MGTSHHPRYCAANRVVVTEGVQRKTLLCNFVRVGGWGSDAEFEVFPGLLER
jgi:hypothetical protein